MKKTKRQHIVAIIQARMASTRLPNKTLVDISGKPLLGHIIERVKVSRTINEIVVATTTDAHDKAILDLAAKYGVKRYAGNQEDVLDRIYQAAKLTSADVIVRITADDPFKDPQVIDKIVKYFIAHPDLDYASNTIEPTYPEGLDVEVFSFIALERAWKEAILPSEREHVTPYIWKNPNLFKVANIKYKYNLSGLRWTLDYEDDLKFTREIYKRLYHGEIFLMDDILVLLEKEPYLANINKGVAKYIGYLKSLEKDKELKEKDKI